MSHIAPRRIEITNDVRLLLPIMISVMVAKLVADRITHPLYHALIHFKRIPFLSPELETKGEVADAFEVRFALAFSPHITPSDASFYSNCRRTRSGKLSIKL